MSSWLSTITDQAAIMAREATAVTRDMIKETVAEEEDAEAALSVAREQLVHSVAEVEALRAELSRVHADRDEAQQRAEAADVQVSTISTEYRHLLIDKENECIELRRKLEQQLAIVTSDVSRASPSSASGAPATASVGTDGLEYIDLNGDEAHVGRAAEGFVDDDDNHLLMEDAPLRHNTLERDLHDEHQEQLAALQEAHQHAVAQMQAEFDEELSDWRARVDELERDHAAAAVEAPPSTDEVDAVAGTDKNTTSVVDALSERLVSAETDLTEARRRVDESERTLVELSEEHTREMEQLASMHREALRRAQAERALVDAENASNVERVGSLEHQLSEVARQVESERENARERLRESETERKQLATRLTEAEEAHEARMQEMSERHGRECRDLRQRLAELVEQQHKREEEDSSATSLESALAEAHTRIAQLELKLDEQAIAMTAEVTRVFRAVLGYADSEAVHEGMTLPWETDTCRVVVHALLQRVVGDATVTGLPRETVLEPLALAVVQLVGMDARLKREMAEAQSLRDRVEELKLVVVEAEANTALRQQGAEEMERLTRRLSRLQQHMVEQEENATRDALLQQETIRVLEQRVASAEALHQEREDFERQNTETTGLQLSRLAATVDQLTLERDTLRASLKESVTECEQRGASLANLQSVLEQFQEDQELQVSMATERAANDAAEARAQLSDAEGRLAALERERTVLVGRLETAQAMRTDLLTSERELAMLRKECDGMREKMARSQDRLKAAVRKAAESSVDKNVMRNLLLSYLTGQKSGDVLSLMANVLELSEADRARAGIGRSWLGRVVSSTLGNTAGSATAARPNASHVAHAGTSESFSDAFVEFLLSEADNGTTDTEAATTES